MAKLTEKSLATAVTLNSLIHIVNTGDTTQSAYGSSYKAELSQLVPLFGSNPDVTITGGTYNPSTGEVTFYNNTGGTFNVSGFITGFTDSFVSGGTYTAGTATFTNTTGGTFNVTGFTSGDTNFANTNLTFTGSRDHDTNGNYLSITTDGGGFTEGWIYLDITGVNQGAWIGYDSNYVRTFGQGIDIFASDGVLTNLIEIFTGGTTFNTNTVSGVYFNVKTNSDPYSLYINGTSGNVGIGTDTPSEKLEVSGKTKTINFQMTSGATNGYVLTSDASGNASWEEKCNCSSFSAITLTANTVFSERIKGKLGPLLVNDTDLGNVYFGSTSGVTIDVPNRRIGIKTATPSYDLEVSGTTSTTNIQITSGATNGYVLTSDASGNGTWQSSSGGVSIDPFNNVGSTGTSFTWNVSGLSTNYQVTLTANTTLNLSNVRNGDYGTLIVSQDAVGSRTITFGTVNGAGTTHRVANGGAGSPTLTSNINAIDILTFTYNGSTMFWTVGNDYT